MTDTSTVSTVASANGDASATAAQAPVAPGAVGTVNDPATAGLPRPGSLPTPASAAAAAKDKTLTSPVAVELARTALGRITEPLSVGEHVAAGSEGERLVTHLFDCNLAGYEGWRWAVTLTRPPRSRTATVCELELLPGEDALLAPAWIPWVDRLAPGDVSRSDRLPRRETDERLEPGWEAAKDGEGDTTGTAGTDAQDFGRVRVLSAEGVQRAAQRWYDGDHGPDADGVRKAHATCSDCGFLIPLAGPLRNVFGICANEWAADDGRVVSLDHGCGAHSETDLPDQGSDWPVTPSRLDELAMEPIGTDGVSIRGGVSQAEERERAAQEAEQEALAAEEADGAEPEDAEAQAEPVEAKASKKAGKGKRKSGKSSKAGKADKPEKPAKADKGGKADNPKKDKNDKKNKKDKDDKKDKDVEKLKKASASGRRASAGRTGESVEGEASAEERRASARDAVAGLGLVGGAHEAPAAQRPVPTTLAELEAHLPTRR